MPVERRPGDPVFAATIIEHGQLKVRVDRVGLDTVVGRIVRAIESAAAEKSEIQLFAERLADREVGRRWSSRRSAPASREASTPARPSWWPTTAWLPGSGSDRPPHIHSARLRGRDPDQGTEGAREPGAGRHRRLRQDGDPDIGYAARDPGGVLPSRADRARSHPSDGRGGVAVPAPGRPARSFVSRHGSEAAFQRHRGPSRASGSAPRSRSRASGSTSAAIAS